MTDRRIIATVGGRGFWSGAWAAALGVSVALSAGNVRGDVIELKSGQKMEGAVLKEEAEAIYVDLGVEIVRVPIAQIKSRAKSSQAEEVPPQAATDEAYQMARLPVRSIIDLAMSYGEGVVLVQTPAGLGAGFGFNA
ncbi:MAG: hypothetical protein AB7O26_08420, partial [Planctomycetaceae bacterium]